MRRWHGTFGVAWGLVLAAAVHAEPGAERQAALVRLVRQDCGACHGLSLQGGLGPALTAEALAGKGGETLAAVIAHGRPGTPMPPFASLLSTEEIAWIVERLQQGFPPLPVGSSSR
ncbi:c-type cytochrome [Tepidiphilus margaritifer]|uniref:c-type cytochrome n=1 Tax=Tepidiphilus margaritifer TaxID=203471 RepID=UPI00042A2BB0|nr:cytochrome c [Tepidiphilus margaritifer]